MRRTLSILVAVVATFAIAGTALAAKPADAGSGNPHFVGTPTLSGDTITFKAAGLGSVSEATFSATYDVTVYAQCYTRSGNRPAADNKTDTYEDSTVSGTFPVRNGQTSGTLTLTSPGSTLTCPPGQNRVVETSFTNVVLSGMGLTHSF